jgi:hypothetical protein
VWAEQNGKAIETRLEDIVAAYMGLKTAGDDSEPGKGEADGELAHGVDEEHSLPFPPFGKTAPTEERNILSLENLSDFLETFGMAGS